MKPRKCRICKSEYTPFSSLQKVCGPSCAIQLVEKDRKRHEAKARAVQRRETKKLRESLRSRSWWLKSAQSAFNAYIRERDKAKPCISCGRYHDGQYHAGHYRTTAAAPELRFHPFNCHKQCAPCNNHLSGNLIQYRASLLRDRGQGILDWLEGPHELQRWTIDDLREIRDWYKQQLKEMKNANR